MCSWIKIFKLTYCSVVKPQSSHSTDSPHRKEVLTYVYFSTSCQNCCIMSLTLLDEFKKPFWCVSSPVSMKLEKTTVSYDYDGEHFLIHYLDSDGQVRMELVWMEEQKQFVVISLVVYVSVSNVNKYFGRDYWTCCISGTSFEVFNHYTWILWLYFFNFFVATCTFKPGWHIDTLTFLRRLTASTPCASTH